MIIGNMVRNPEMRTTPSGQNVTSFSIATNRVWNDTNGQKQERVEFHNIVAWARLAEISNQYLKKGSKVYIEGRLQTRSWDDPNGVKKYRTEIVVENMIMLDRAGNISNSGDFNTEQPAVDKTPAVDVNATPSSTKQSNNSEEEISIEDIPF